MIWDFFNLSAQENHEKGGVSSCSYSLAALCCCCLLDACF
ncbi:hypothetical protein E1A91_A04G150600v1 [Gossypium mustelinum]|uniref:Uncharacterized protein n=1 Tax=Gossypium mustelinum TaxID=34275 RepID=A0A5D2ZR22_GOSMU|nr:hypothetical protein E1A91_A04G150600v1 [Gossypium mustelinum]